MWTGSKALALGPDDFVQFSAGNDAMGRGNVMGKYPVGLGMVLPGCECRVWQASRNLTRLQGPAKVKGLGLHRAIQSPEPAPGW